MARQVYIGYDGKATDIGTTAGAGAAERPGYSTAEKFTGEYWFDGKPIYRLLATGTITVAAETEHRLSLAAGVENLVHAGGWLRGGGHSGTKIALFGDSDQFIKKSLSVNSAGELTMPTTSSTIREGNSLSDYQVWVEYTKAAG